MNYNLRILRKYIWSLHIIRYIFNNWEKYFILKKEREMRALVLSATIFILSVLMITNEEQASFAVSLFSEFEDIEDGPR